MYVNDEILELVMSRADEPLRDTMQLAYLTGQRPVDVLAMTRGQIREDELHIKQTKHGAKLPIKIEGQFQLLIEKLLKRTRGMHLLSDMASDRFTKSTLRGAFDRARDSAVIQKFDRGSGSENFSSGACAQKPLQIKTIQTIYLQPKPCLVIHHQR